MAKRQKIELDRQTSLCARKLIDIEDRPSPVRTYTVDKAVSQAAYILKMIDEKWPAWRGDALARGEVSST